MNHQASRDQTPSPRYLDIAGSSRRQLETLMMQGHTPDLDALAGWLFRGTNTPAAMRLLGIKKFIKGFYRADNGQFFGYNAAVRQNRLARPWITRPSPDTPRPFGFFRVTPVDPTARDNAYLHAALLDYSQGHNPVFDPSTTLRDYLVEIPDSAGDIYLGKAYVALGQARIPTSYFVLERLRPGPAAPRF